MSVDGLDNQLKVQKVQSLEVIIKTQTNINDLNQGPIQISHEDLIFERNKRRQNR